MVFIVLLDLAEFLKLEIFSFAVICTTSFRLALLRIGPVFNCFMGGQFDLKQVTCHAQNESRKVLTMNSLYANTSRNRGFYRFDFVPTAGNPASHLRDRIDTTAVNGLESRGPKFASQAWLRGRDCLATLIPATRKDGRLEGWKIGSPPCPIQIFEGGFRLGGLTVPRLSPNIAWGVLLRFGDELEGRRSRRPGDRGEHSSFVGHWRSSGRRKRLS